MLVTPQNVRWAHTVFARELEKLAKGKRFKLAGPCMLPVHSNVARQVTTRDEAFGGGESLIVTGVFVAEEGYNKYKSVVIFKPTWPTDFANTRIDISQAVMLFEGFADVINDIHRAIETNLDLKKAFKVFELAEAGAVATVSKETLKDERFGSW